MKNKLIKKKFFPSVRPECFCVGKNVSKGLSNGGRIITVVLMTISLNIYSWFEHDTAVCAAAKGDWVKAKELLTHAVVNDSGDASVLYDAGVASYRTKDFVQAAAYFEQAAQVTQPSQNSLKEQAYFNAGNAYAQLKEFDKAIDAYDQVLALDAKHEKALHNKEVVKKMKEKQQQQDQQKKDQQDKDKKDNKDDNKKDDQKKQQKKDNNKSEDQQKNDEQKNKQDQQSSDGSQNQQQNQGQQKQSDNSSSNEKQQQQSGADQSEQKKGEDTKAGRSGEQEEKESQQQSAHNKQGQQKGNEQKQLMTAQAGDKEKDKQEMQGITLEPQLISMLDEREKKDAQAHKQLIKALVGKEGAKTYGKPTW